MRSGYAVRKLREAISEATGEFWSQRRLAEFLGVSPGAIAHYELGARPNSWAEPLFERLAVGLRLVAERDAWTIVEATPQLDARFGVFHELWVRRTEQTVEVVMGYSRYGMFLPIAWQSIPWALWTIIAPP